MPETLRTATDAGVRSVTLTRADEYNTIYASAEELGRRRAVLDDACRRHGRDPGTLMLSLMTGCVLGSDQGEVRERARRVQERTGRDGDVDTFLRDNRDTWILGTLDEVAARLGELERAGVSRVFLQHLDHADLEAVALMGRLAAV